MNAAKKRRPLLDDAWNMFGPLSEDVRARIVTYLNGPTFEKWDEVHGVIIAERPRGPRTVWQAVVALDPSFAHIGLPHGRRAKPRAKWAKIPDALLVARAIRSALT